MMNKKFFLAIISILALLFASIASSFVFAEDKKEEKKELKSNYDDLYNGDWQIEYADWGIERGVIKLFDDNTVRVNEEVSEAELMEMIARYVGLTEDYSKSSEKLYEDLKNIGIMSSGTMVADKRKEVTTVEDGLLIALSIHDNENYKNRKDKINRALEEINKDGDSELELTTELRKVDALKILKLYESNGSELIVGKPTSEIGDDWKTAYVGDKVTKRISYLERESGLLVNIIQVPDNYKKEKNLNSYYKYLSGKDLSTVDNVKYLINIKSVGSKSLDVLGLSVLVKDGAPKTLVDKQDYISLGGKSNITLPLSGSNISEMKVIIGNKTIDVDLNDFKKFDFNSMYITQNESSNLNFVIFKLEDKNIKDVDYNLEHAFYNEYVKQEKSK